MEGPMPGVPHRLIFRPTAMRVARMRQHSPGCSRWTPPATQTRRTPIFAPAWQLCMAWHLRALRWRPVPVSSSTASPRWLRSGAPTPWHCRRTAMWITPMPRTHGACNRCGLQTLATPPPSCSGRASRRVRWASPILHGPLGADLAARLTWHRAQGTVPPQCSGRCGCCGCWTVRTHHCACTAQMPSCTTLLPDPSRGALRRCLACGSCGLPTRPWA